MKRISGFFKRIGSWIRLRRLRRIYRRSSSRMATQIDEIETAMIRSQSKLARAIEENSRELADTSAMLEELKQAVENLRADQASLESESEGLRNRLKVAEDITIPTLTQAHKLVLERWEAETDIAIKSKVAVRQ